MTNQHKAYILQIIRNDGDISPLTSDLTYYEISVQLGNFIAEGLVEMDEQSHLRLSTEGVKTLERLKNANGKKCNPFIEPQINYKVTPVDIDSIYLPELKTIEDLK